MPSHSLPPFRERGIAGSTGDFLEAAMGRAVTAVLGCPFIVVPSDPMRNQPDVSPAEMTSRRNADLKERLRPIVKEIHDRMYPGCETCAKTGRLDAKRDALMDVVKRLEASAASLFLQKQENEARYLRDKIIGPIQDTIGSLAEMMAGAFEDEFHTCTLTGKPPMSPGANEWPSL